MVCLICSRAASLYTPTVGHVLTLFSSTAMKPHEVTDKLQLTKLKDKLWFVQPAIAIEGEGLTEGFGWLSDNIKKMPKYGGK